MKEQKKQVVEIEDQVIKVKRGQAFKDLEQQGKEIVRENYYEIIDILKTYIDMREDYYPLVALWIIGTYLHKNLESYPYLYLNAMRGSGKSKTLKLITTLSNEGEVMASPTEAVLFRTNGTLGIDEFEGVASKEKAAIRELLNASYKKGTKIFRMKKKKVLGQEEQVPESFEPYRPIVMANISGMEEVLADRCISLILEKSSNDMIIMLVEDFDSAENVQKVIKNFKLCSLCSVVSIKNIYKSWNNYIFNRYKTTLTTYNTYNTLTTHNTLRDIKLDSLFNKIHDSGIRGRNLELFLPIFLISNIVSEEVLKETIKIAVGITNERKYDEGVESTDISVYDFVAKQEAGLEYFSIKTLTNQFKEFVDESPDWLNTKWFGRALKRLNLVVDKRRKHKGIEVILNVAKAKEKIRIFKGEEK